MHGRYQHVFNWEYISCFVLETAVRWAWGKRARKLGRCLIDVDDSARPYQLLFVDYRLQYVSHEASTLQKRRCSSSSEAYFTHAAFTSRWCRRGSCCWSDFYVSRLFSAAIISTIYSSKSPALAVSSIATGVQGRPRVERCRPWEASLRLALLRRLWIWCRHDFTSRDLDLRLAWWVTPCWISRFMEVYIRERGTNCNTTHGIKSRTNIPYTQQQKNPIPQRRANSRERTRNRRSCLDQSVTLMAETKHLKRRVEKWESEIEDLRQFVATVGSADC